MSSARRRRIPVALTLALALAVPALSAGAAEGDPPRIVSDAFSGPLDTALWSFANPRGDATVTSTGTQAVLSLPQGPSHNLWTGINDVGWLHQPAPNEDLAVELKFDSVPTKGTQMQGLLVAEAPDRLVRVDVHHNGGGPRLFVATVTPANTVVRRNIALTVAPTHLRVERTANSWVVRHSTDGTTWTTEPAFSFQLAVTGVGPFVGNYSTTTAPAFAAVVDYFWNLAEPGPPTDPAGEPDTTPPVVSAVAVAPGVENAQVTWTTDEPATSRVDHGPTTALGTTVTDTTLRTEHSIALGALECETTYHFTVSSTDAAGNTTTTVDSTFMTAACPGDPGDPGDPAVRVMHVGDSVTAGSSFAADSYRYFSTTHWRTTTPTDLQMVGPFVGVSTPPRAPTVGYSAWPEEWTYHAAQVGWPLRDLTGLLRDQVETYDPDVLVAFPAFILQGDATQQDFEDFVAQARLGNPDIDIVFGLPHYGTPFTQAQTDQYRARLRAAATALDTPGSRVRLVDTNAAWSPSWHGSSHEGRYPRWTEGATKVAIRFVDGVHAHLGIGDAWPTAVPPTVVVEGSTLRWGYDPAVDVWIVERGGVTVGTVPNVPSAPFDGTQPVMEFSAPTDGTYRVHGVRYVDGIAEPISTTERSADAVVEPQPPTILVPPADQTAEIGTTATFNVVASGADPLAYQWERDGELVPGAEGTSFTIGPVTAADDGAEVRVIVSNSLGTVVSNVAILSAVEPPPRVVSDAFSGALDTDLWTFVDPLGDASISATGTQAVLSLPAGQSHNLWGSTNDVAWLRQVAPEGDFAVEVKFDSTPTSGYQMQGLVVAEAPDHLVRVDVHHDGSTARLFAATITPTSTTTRASIVLPAPHRYLRLERAGNAWTVQSSPDGTTWTAAPAFTFPLAPTGFGPFAGNYSAGIAPAFAATVDYVWNLADPGPPADEPGSADTIPPVLSAVSVAPITVDGATVGWSTNEPATSRVDSGTTTALGTTQSDATLRTTHSVALNGLTCATTYHYTVSSTDAAGNTATSSTATFTTAACPPNGPGLASDAFSGPLDTTRWTFVNPLGDATVGATGTQAVLSLPQGPSHNLWKGINDVGWLRQAAANSDFGVEVKFDSVPTKGHQMQGLVIAEAPDRLVRVDVHHNGAGPRLFVATITPANANTRVNLALPNAPAYLRVVRTGNSWSVRYSSDGVTWNTTSPFVFSLTVTGIGPFVGNYSTKTAPAFDAAVDYFWNLAEAGPPLDEPGDPGDPDTTPPAVSGLAVSAASDSASVTWSTNELATSRVDHGPTAALGTTTSDPTPRTLHAIQLTDLACSTTYHYAVSATDAAQNTTTTPTATFTTQSCSSAPVIDVWYGESQRFGHLGQGQRWVNIVGNVSHDVGIQSLSYRLNGGAPQGLSRGPNNRRLQEPGDFTTEIDFSDLVPGANQVLITAVSTTGISASKQVALEYVPNPAPALPYSTDFGAASSAQDAVQSVDGHWIVQGDTLRINRLGYDRLALVGDIAWTDYEVRVPFTVHSFGPGAYSYLSGSPMVGVALRWQGHTHREGSQETQPRWWWYPTGAFAWFLWPEGTGQQFQLLGNDNAPSTNLYNQSIPFGVQHVMKVRVETISDGTRYSVKWWQADSTEPTAWTTSIVEPDGPASGSIGLLAHHVDASFGNVTVTPL